MIPDYSSFNKTVIIDLRPNDNEIEETWLWLMLDKRNQFSLELLSKIFCQTCAFYQVLVFLFDE